MDDIILFLTNIPFIKQHIVDMYVAEIGQNFDTALLDLSEVYGFRYDAENMVEDAKRIRSFDEFERELAKYSTDRKVLVITNILNQNLGPIYPVLKKFRIPILCINKESFNTWLFEQGTFQYYRFFGWKAKLQSLAYRLPLSRMILNRQQFGRFPYDYLLASQNYYPMQTRRFLKINHIKYDEYLNSQDGDRFITYKYILYIDSAPTTHPSFSGRSNSLDHGQYIRKLNTYFENLERATNLPVVISLHPKAQYAPDELGDRQIYLGNTAQLIHDCEFAVCHYSTSLVNVVLENKPLQILYSNEMFRSAFRGSIIMGLEFAKLCNASVCDMNADFRFNLKVDQTQYQKFLNENICDEMTKGQKNAQLITGYLTDIFEHIENEGAP